MDVLKSVKFGLSKAWQISPKFFLTYLFTQIILALTSVVNIYTFKEIVNAANKGVGIFGLSLVAIVTIRGAYELIRLLVQALSAYSWASFESKQALDMNKEFVEKISTLDLASFEDPNTVGLIQRCFSRIQMQIKIYLRYIVFLLSNCIELAVVIGIFISASPIAAIAIVLANLIPVWVRKKQSFGVFTIFRANDEVRKKFGYTSQLVQERETLPEIKVDQGFGFFKRRLSEIYEGFAHKQLALEKKHQFYGSVADFLPATALFGLTIYMAQKAVTGVIDAGTFVFYFTNIFAFSGAMERFKSSIGNLTADTPFMNEAVEFFELKPQIQFPILTSSQKEELASKLKNPLITFENVVFQYPNSEVPALSGVNLEIPYGQNIALVGENGAGKTTLVKLLMRMYDPISGRILINGKDIRDIPEDLLFSLYSTLFQNFGKFYLTVRENLQLAAGKDLSEEEMVKYLKFSNAWEFIENQKHGLDQQLGPEYKEGVDLSGGQWQRLAIARAYAKQAPILILDEPTSAVDARSEAEIFDRLNTQMKKNTLLFISHRFSTIKDAERIVVMDKGKIIEDGTHGQLIEKGGKYAKLYRIQAERYTRKDIKTS